MIRTLELIWDMMGCDMGAPELTPTLQELVDVGATPDNVRAIAGTLVVDMITKAPLDVARWLEQYSSVHLDLPAGPLD
jgi:hypothetical protein